MACGAIDRCLVRPMAAHASAHREIRFLCQLFPLRHRTMAILAGRTAFGMHFVAEVYPTGNLVNASPRNFLFRGSVSLQVLNRGGIGLDRAMTNHALRSRGKCNYLARLRRRMALRALQAQRGVLLMAERNGLWRRSWRWKLREQSSRAHHPRKKRRLQISLARMRSAM